MIFFLNKGMGHGNSGVEHAQFYRGKLFNSKKIPFKLVFNNFLPELHKHAQEWELNENQLIGIYDYFLAEDPDDYLENGLSEINDFNETVLIDKSNTQRIITRKSTGNYIAKVQRVKRYSEKNKMLMVSDARVTLTSETKSGTHMVSWIYRDGGSRGSLPVSFIIENFKGKNYRFNNFEEFNHFFLEQLIEHFGDNSMFMVDRGNENEESLVELRLAHPNLRLVDVIHAAHLTNVENNHYLWNNHYQFMFENVDVFDRVVVSTKLQRDQVIENLGPSFKDKVVAIPVGGVPNVAKARTWNGETVKFVTASRLHEEKHISHIIRAIDILKKRNPNVELYIYGAGADLAPLEKLTKELNLENQVKFMGLSQQMIKDLGKYDAFVGASYSEGFGLTYIEAMANGMPIASYGNLFGAQELIKDGVTGYLADFERTMEEEAVVRNIDKLALAMAKIFESPEHYKKLSEETVKFSEEFTNSHIADQWAEFIKI